MGQRCTLTVAVRFFCKGILLKSQQFVSNCGVNHCIYGVGKEKDVHCEAFASEREQIILFSYGEQAFSLSIEDAPAP
ncbi:hypothetical protein IC582_001629 [Cucumis melo]